MRAVARRRTGSEAAVSAAGETAKLTRRPIKAHWHDDISHHGEGTAAHVLGVAANDEGDLAAFLADVGFTSAVVVGLFGVFCLLRLRYPLMYSNNAQPSVGTAPFVERKTMLGSLLGWVSDSLSISDDDMERAAGLDGLMLAKFLELCMKICCCLAVPNLILAGALNIWQGHNSTDNLSKIGFASVQEGSWLCYLHAALVWLAVVIVERLTIDAHREFIEQRRYQWLGKMPMPQSTTVLVECVPHKYRSDAALFRLFENLFGKGHVKLAHMVLPTGHLLSKVAEVERLDHLLKSAEYEWEQTGEDPDRRPQHHDLWEGGAAKDSITHYKERRREAAKEAEAMRAQLLKDTADPESRVGSSSGFVTFNRRHEQELALQVTFSEDSDDFVMSLPPDPSDVIYTDLEMDPDTLAGREFVGKLCIVGIFLGFMPFVIGVSSLVSLPALEHRYPLLREHLEMWPRSVAYVSNMLAVLGLKLFMAFLPTCLMLVFRNFFCLRAGAWAQQELHIYYFWFLVVFEILATIVGTSLVKTLCKLLDHPTGIVELLGTSLPQATHFYLNYMVVTWGTAALDATRYVQLFKFLGRKAFLPEEKARELAEPEDQNYFGQGGRCARFSETMVMALVFSSLSPLILLLALVNFALCRVVYGYLMVWAETKKPDLGGVFWVNNLRHLQWGLLIYILTMTGSISIQSAKDAPPIPPIICLSSALWLYKFHRKFESLLWLKLPMTKFGEEDDESMRAPARSSYRQPELLDAVDPK